MAANQTPQTKLLVVDDEPDIVELLSASLKYHGYEVATANSGRQAMEEARRFRPDMILLDVMMPELDGPATLEALRERDETRTIPVLFMTAKAQAGELSRYAALGVAGVIPKPFDPMTLHERVSGALGWDAI